MFEALSQLVTLALEEIPLPELEPDQQFILEPIEGWGIAIHTVGMIIELVEFCGDVIVPCGGVHYVEGYNFYECQCKRCQILNSIGEKWMEVRQAGSSIFRNL